MELHGLDSAVHACPLPKPEEEPVLQMLHDVEPDVAFGGQ